MINEHLRSYQISIIISIILGLILAFIDIRIANGLFLGLLASFIYLWMMTYNVGWIVSLGNGNKWLLILTFMKDILLMSAVFIVTFVCSDIFNYWGLFIGLILEKFIFVLMNFRG